MPSPQESWTDPSHPRARRALRELWFAVAQLRLLIKPPANSVPVAVVQGFIDRLVSAIRVTALVAISDAASVPRGNPQLAGTQLALGDARAAQGKPGQAAWRYLKAWVLVQ